MSNKRIKIDIAFITPGMYVAQLDRPWLESPFSSHGFEIAEEGQMQLLRKFCKHVYVDLARSSLDPKKILAAHSRKARDPLAKPVLKQRTAVKENSGGFLGGLASKLGLSSQEAHAETSLVYRTSVPLKKEAAKAEEAFIHAKAQTAEILEEVKNRKGVNVDKLRKAVTPMVDSIVRNPDAMTWLCYARDRDHSGLCLTVESSVWAVVLGRHLGLDQFALINLAMGGAMLDLGNANIPSSIVMKNGEPSDDEAEILRMHVEYGVKLLKQSPGIGDEVLAMIACHHEHHDGSGFPNGIGGDDIPVVGRIAALANYFDRMISVQPYGTPKSTYSVVCGLNALGGKLFQPELVQHFVQAVGMFPTGSLVGLQTGEVAMVLEQNRVHRLRPKVLLLTDKTQKRLSSPKLLDLTKVPDSGTRRKARWITGGHVLGAYDIDPQLDWFE